MPSQILELNVKEDKVEWNFCSCDRAGRRGTPTKQGDKELPQEPLIDSTLDLLVAMQHLLSDALRNGRFATQKLSELKIDVGPLEAVSDQCAKTDEALYKLAKILGQHLYRFLIPGDLDTALRSTLNDADPGDTLRLQLYFSGKSRALLSRWPWEYLFLPDLDKPGDGEFLAVKTKLVLNRHVFFDTDKSWTLTTIKPKVLLVAAGLGEGFDPVPSDEIVKKLEDLQKRGLIQLVTLIEPKFDFTDRASTATFERFEECIEKETPNIIHFIGHGQSVSGRGELAFVGPGSRPNWVTDEEFADAAEKSGNKLKLVFLQACESALPDPHGPFSSVAEKLVSKNVPAIVAMQAKIENSLATDFALTFYDELARGEPIDFAVRQAREGIRKQLVKQKRTAFGVPVLYLRNYDSLIELTSQPGGPSASRTFQRDAEEKVKCINCPAANSPNSVFCTQCGTRLICGNANCRARLEDPEGRFCPKCGLDIKPKPSAPSTPIASAPSEISPPQPAPGSSALAAMASSRQS